MARELFKLRLFGKQIVFEYVGTARPGEPDYDIAPQLVEQEPVQTGLYMPIPLPPQPDPERSNVTMEYSLLQQPEPDSMSATVEHPLEHWQEPETSSVTTEQIQAQLEPARQSATIEERLRQLDSLRDKGIITPAEYDEQRAKILSEL
jgi:hypothetical protein